MKTKRSPTAPLAEAAADSGAALAELRQRLAQMEGFANDMAAAVDSLVSAVLDTRGVADAAHHAALALAQEQAQAHAQAHAQAIAAAPANAPDNAALQKKLAELEHQLSVERSCRDLAQVSRMHPKTRSLVFVGTTYFGCNVKYAYLGLREAAQRAGIACRFLPFHAEQEAQVKALGGLCFPAGHAQWSSDDIHQALSAAVLVTSDHFLNPNPFAPALLAGARQIQLWHGVSIKEIGLRNLGSGRQLGPHLARVLATCGPYASLVGTAAADLPDWQRWFAFQRYAPIGYPRNDVLYREPTEADLANVDRACFDLASQARGAGKRVFLYAPTFRDADRGQWLLGAGLERIAAAVARKGDLLIVNLHPVEQPLIAQLAPQLPGVHFTAPRTDIYPLLGRTSALITDYSSLMFDYLHLKQPILLFRPDHAAYTERSRKLFDDKLRVFPGPMVSNADALIGLLRAGHLGQGDSHAAAREELLAAHFDHHDGGSAERLMALVEEELQAQPLVN